MNNPQLTPLRKNNTSAFEVRNERDSRSAQLLNFQNGDKVTFEWKLNESMEQAGMFKLTIGNGADKKVAILNAEEFRRFLRWV